MLKFDTRVAKQLVFLLSVSSTLGFWAIFSHKLDLKLAAGSGTDQGAGDPPPTQAGNQLVLDLPPMPTLIPPLDSARVSLALPPTPSQNLVNIPQPNVPLTGRIFLGGSKPQSKVVLSRLRLPGPLIKMICRFGQWAARSGSHRLPPARAPAVVVFPDGSRCGGLLSHFRRKGRNRLSRSGALIR
jgi:hypothetical protein